MSSCPLKQSSSSDIQDTLSLSKREPFSWHPRYPLALWKRAILETCTMSSCSLLETHSRDIYDVLSLSERSILSSLSDVLSLIAILTTSKMSSRSLKENYFPRRLRCPLTLREIQSRDIYRSNWEPFSRHHVMFLRSIRESHSQVSRHVRISTLSFRSSRDRHSRNICNVLSFSERSLRRAILSKRSMALCTRYNFDHCSHFPRETCTLETSLRHIFDVQETNII